MAHFLFALSYKEINLLTARKTNEEPCKRNADDIFPSNVKNKMMKIGHASIGLVMLGIYENPRNPLKIARCFRE